MNAAQQILEIFEAHGIDTVFGYPGGCIMPLYDALVDSAGVTHVLCRHEQGCALAADGYARSSGRVGVAIATSGPGATNLITGVANAHRDSVPMVVITGQTPSTLIGTDAFQEVDVLGMTLDIVKHSALVTRPEDVGPAIDQALRLAASGRPGPVWIDIPKDVLQGEVTVAARIAAAEPRRAPARGPAHAELAAILDLLRRARRPLLYSGGGVSRGGAEAAFRDFVAASGLPHVHSLNGIGNAGRASAEDLGMLGMHGSKAANQAVDACDLLLVVGARLDDRATGRLDGFAPNARLIHLDIDAAELNKRRGAEFALRGELTPTLSDLAAVLAERPLAIAAWRRQCRDWRARDGFKATRPVDPAAPVAGPAFVRALSAAAPADAIVACDVGQHQMWVAQHFVFDAPRNHLSSGGLGTMGYGLPAAIGAQFAHPARTVINVAGDGSFMMNVQELATIRRHRLPVKIVLADNACLGLVRQQQELFYANRESQIDLDDNPDFAALVAAFDIPTHRVTCWGEIESGLRTLFATPGAALLHVAIDRADNVWPTVAPGRSNREMLHAASLSPQPLTAARRSIAEA
ncbi:acetolactate synthase 2 catalytic subunit [Salinisphaera sp. LB1]|uniref:acetolactate synthase 2 catalytic subunit n=1 Tax=Salinisphaera sp. LB1 TaxID=2183911 RepID=UPI000D707FCB|nr:acetolactate synthase 2 catalytic subunit [Salinisphaera sp. LB1]AWN16243.1 Acetolactate synthase large subunit [Salinisphaera sp. LB1]